MKKYLAVLAVLISFSSCIKVEQVPLCANAPAAPSVTSSNFTVPFGSYFYANIVNPNSSYTYTWIPPSTQYYTYPKVGTSISSYPYYGTWSVIAQNGSCASDTTKFNLNLAMPSCGLSKNTFQVGSGAAYAVSLVNSYDNYNSYELSFQDASGYSLNVYFLSMPAVSQAYTLTTPYSNLSSNQCYIMYNGGYGFNSYSGNVTVEVTGQTITIGFCGATFSNQSSGQYTTCNGYIETN